MSNNDRSNPFRLNERENFPPLDDFFDESNNVISLPSDINSLSESPDKSFCSRTSVSWHDLSLDMSIGGRAAMAVHRFQVRKYGLDASSETLPDSQKTSPLSEEDEWDRLMDDSCSQVSLSSTAIMSGKKHDSNLSRSSRQTAFSSSDSDASSSFFDKSMVKVLMTPEKAKRHHKNEVDANKLSLNGVTLRDGPDSNSPGDCSIEYSANVSSTCSGVEGMFHAALRFHDDFEVQSSFARDDESFLAGRSMKDKNSSISFAADTSFATNDSRNTSRRRPNGKVVESEFDGDCIGFEFLPASPIHKSNKDESLCGDSSIFGSPVSPFFRGTDALKTSSSTSITLSTQKTNEGESDFYRVTTSGKDEMETDLSFLGLSPIASQPGYLVDRSNQTSLPLPFDERMKNEQLSTSCKISPTKSTKVPKSMQMRRKSLDLSFASSEKSGDSCLLSSPVSTFAEGDTSFSNSRTFGSNAAYRLNRGNLNVKPGFLSTQRSPCTVSQSTALSDETDPTRCERTPDAWEENRRGVRLSRASQLRALGFKRECSYPNHQPYNERTYDF